MNHLHTDRLRNDLGLISSDIQRLLHDATDDAGGLAQETRAKLEAVRAQVAELERDASERTGQRLARARDRLRAQPWLLVSAVAAGGFLLGWLGRGRIE